ncbi:MAG: M6 family metalloprotease domain-containing protein, partial [bacterium]
MTKEKFIHWRINCKNSWSLIPANLTFILKLRLFIPIWIFMLLVISMAFGDVPHPRVQSMIQNGEIEIPYYLQNLDELRALGVNTPAELPDGSTVPGPPRNTEVNYNAIAILVDFSDNTSQVMPSFFDNLLYGTGSGTVRHYYDEVTYGNLTVVTVNLPSTLGWYRAPQTYAYYVNNQNGFGSYPQNARKLAEDAIALADPLVDFSQYDNDGDGYVDALFIIHAGPGAEFTGSSSDIWSHKWATSSPQPVDGVLAYVYSMEPEYWQNPGDMTCGVYAHEMGHSVFGLPDVYDRDGSSRGLGRWSLMAGGSWNGSLGNSPAHPDAYNRVRMGYVTPQNITTDTTSYSLPNIQGNQTMVRLWTNGTMGTQYFLVENRQRAGYDSALPAAGLCIYHVDETVGTQNDNEWYPGHTSSGHYLVALEQADGLWQLEMNTSSGNGGDPFPGNTSNRVFDNNSTPD